nr:MAG TPA: hypothetical protein [Caudoviricetes sp.]
MVHVICVCTRVCLTILCTPSLPVTAKDTLLRAGGLTGATSRLLTSTFLYSQLGCMTLSSRSRQRLLNNTRIMLIFRLTAFGRSSCWPFLRTLSGAAPLNDSIKTSTGHLREKTMLNDEQFNELADKLLKVLAPKLGVELEEEKPKSATVVQDKYGEEYDLEQCAIGPCVITAEGSYFLHVEEGIPGNDDYKDYWITTWGDRFSTQQLASILTEHSGDFEVIQD